MIKKEITGYDIYKIDDWFILIGWFGFITTVILVIIFSTSLWNDIPEVDPSYYMAAAIFIFIGAIVLLNAGYYLRLKERKINSILNSLEIALEVSVPQLLDATGYNRRELENSFYSINRLGMGYYVWNRSTDTIADGRLLRKMVFVKQCPSCGSKIGRSFSIIIEEIPSCDYCGNPLDINHWNELKFRVIEEIRWTSNEYGPGMEQARAGDYGADDSSARAARPEEAPESGERPAGTAQRVRMVKTVPVEKKKNSFSWLVFIIMLIVFFPAAIVYLVVKTGKTPDAYETIEVEVEEEAPAQAQPQTSNLPGNREQEQKRVRVVAREKIFSFPVFIVLLIFFWPAAVIYLVVKFAQSRKQYTGTNFRGFR
ncbi:MAG: hypothetical protein GY754_05605 [bacterium]|nr:hypothetical protein [bacterium]